MNQSTAFWAQWIELQLKHNLDRMVDLSIKNFHFPGLNYVCFDFMPHQTIRLYIIDPSSKPIDTENVQIHNHLYDSQILVLQGHITNRVYKLNNTRDDYNAYELTSALHPDNHDRKIKLKHLTKRGLDEVKTIELHPGDMHYQPHTEIHNVTNDQSLFTAFMVFEFPTVKKHSVIWTRKEYPDLTIPTPDAYLKYEPQELKALVTRMLEQMKIS
jgi:hypothetical protein